jgi:hypothetical protein
MMLNDTSHPETNHVWLHICEVNNLVRIIETESKTMAGEGVEGGRGGGRAFSGNSCSFIK